MSTGAASEAEIESTEKQLPLAPASGCTWVTASAACRSVNTLSHCRNRRWTLGSYWSGTGLPGLATFTQVEAIGLDCDPRVHWKTPAAVETIVTSAVPP